MQKSIVCAVVVLGLLLGSVVAPPVAAQEEAGRVGRVFFIKAKIGHAQQFEEAAKEHLAWRKQQGDTWTWHAWQIQTGHRFGQYMWGTFGHKWSDFDNPPLPPQEAAAHFWATVGEHVEKASSEVGVYLPNISLPPEGVPGAAPRPLSMVYTFQLEGGGSVPKFMNAAAKVKKAIEKVNWPSTSFWYVLVSGAPQPTYILSLPQENWADLAPPEKSFPQMLEEAYGRQEAEAVLGIFDKTIKKQYNEIFAYRPDLSYIPEGGM